MGEATVIVIMTVLIRESVSQWVCEVVEVKGEYHNQAIVHHTHNKGPIVPLFSYSAYIPHQPKYNPSPQSTTKVLLLHSSPIQPTDQHSTPAKVQP